MSAKWRAIQHRHKYTYSAVLFPPHLIEALNQTPDGSAFFSELKHLISLNSTYAQLEHVKKVAAAFSTLLSAPNADENAVSSAAKLYLEILFLENSLPLHRTIASALTKCKYHRSSIEDCFRMLCEEYGGGKNASNGSRFCVSRAALSMMGTPKLGYVVEVVEQCAILVALDVISGLQSIVKETDELSRPSPIVMEQCQEALSCMYYLLQRFPEKFYHSLSDQSVMAMAFTSVLSILKSEAFSRDGFVAAGVSFCAALQVCLSPDDLGVFVMHGIFSHPGIRDFDISLDAVVEKIPFKGNLVNEILCFSTLSRLCLIRGILTAVSRTVLDTHYYIVASEGCVESGAGVSTVKTILYDAILPELCFYAENPRDSHSNFHALTVMQICFQQIKTLLLGNSNGNADNYDPIPEEMGARILKIVWNNLEDPLSQTVKQVHLIFDLYLDIQSSLHWAEGSENIKMFLRKIASDLLCLGPRCKGRYVPLASLTRRLGGKAILEMHPDLLYETAKAYIDDDVCCASTTFLKCLLECLRDEYWSSDGVEIGYTKYRRLCLLPFLQGLAFGVAKLRSNLNTYALPALLDLDLDSIFSMLTIIGIEGDDSSLGISGDEGYLSASADVSSTDMTLGLEQRIAVLVSLLKVSRGLALIEGDIDWYEEGSALSPEGALLDMENSNLHCIVLVKGIEVKIPVKWLVLALTHIDESLRMDAAETLFLNPKTASLPSPLELSLMRRAIPLNMRCCSTAFQMKWNSLFRKFFSRVRTALERQLKLGTWKPLPSGSSKGEGLFIGAEETRIHRAEYLFNFIKWFSRFLFFSCYPSAPYERKTMAMELILIMSNVWPVVPTLPRNEDRICLTNNLYPYSKGYTSPDSTLLLVGSIVDSWDRLRECSLQILLYFPTPLPGICNPESVRQAVIWAKKLICSPRVRESDAGALTLRLLFRKYVLDLSWIVQPSCNVVSLSSEAERSNGAYQICTSSSPVVSYMTSLIDWLLAAVEDAEKNLSEACKNSFVHGILLALRYTFEELDWNSNVFQHRNAEMKHLFERLLELVMRITSLALWVVSADAWHLPEDMEEMMDDEALTLEIPDEIDSSASDSQIEVNVEKTAEEEEIKPSEQIVMVGCWLAMKEVSLLLGTVIRKIPLPTSDEMRKSTSNAADESILPSDALLDIQQLETIGNHFLEVLLKMKHNGAIDKTRAGFTALCNRLLCSNDPRLCQLTESWMERLMERTAAKGQTVDDLLRRSAGIPAAFIAFFLSEPEGAPKRLLPRALRWLLDVVTNSLADQLKACSVDGDSCNGSLSKSSQANGSPPASVTNGFVEMSKFRDEGVVPTVHAFNVLRATFNDTNLATDTSGFSAEALIISIRSFSSPYWEVRNSACLSYTALVRRMIGFLNVQKRDSARRAITGLEFFHRYPTLHSFFLNELNVATESLSEGSSDELGSNLKNNVHPSLCPMLIFLSRLKPSPISSETGDSLEPFLFMPFIRRCSFQSNLRIRVLAARALTGLVSNEKLQIVLLNIASELPNERSHSSSSNGTSCSFNSIHGMLLQLNALIDTNCRNLSDPSKRDTVLHELIQILATRSWIARPRQCPSPVLNGCMVKLLDNMLSIAGTCEASKSADTIWNLLWELSSECLDLEPAGCPLYFDPTIQELRKQAATSYFNCIFATSKDIAEDEIVVGRASSSPATSLMRAAGNEAAYSRFQERLIRSMSDASYEVRIASLKWLFLFLKRGEYTGNTCGDQFYCETLKICLTNINLQDTLVKLLISERHHRCVHYLLKNLYTWNSLKFQDNHPSPEPRFICDMDRPSVFKLWNNLVSLFKITMHAKTRQALICCLGVCAKRISSLCMSFISSEVEMETDPSRVFSDFYDALSYFVDLIELNSDASEPVTMRMAAAESMIASEMLTHAAPLGSLIYNHPISNGDISSRFKQEEAIKMYSRRVLNLWLACIRLLEDEDVGLRKRLALDVQKSFPSGEPTEDFEPAAGTSQVEKVIESCFEHLSTVFGHWIDYLDYICCWVMNIANHTNYVSSGGDLVRRVFDKEIDNHHEEKLLICQLCCSHLERLPVSKMSVARDLLQKWRSRFFEQMMAFIHDHVGRRQRDDWIGGVGNHKDTFLPLCANLEAFYALSNRILEEEDESSRRRMLGDVSALGEAMTPFLCNPLISNLYLIVVKSHEKYLGEKAENLNQKWRENDALWGEFNPYFLL
ncbi:thyroid adenoma-associated protein [Salvia divinorum]|uniref:Thyroid adenoma-associated protein n=1 Tax=Salvia divinorum TaxID=28513 RepID=A0ABD1G3J1_SALDI